MQNIIDYLKALWTKMMNYGSEPALLDHLPVDTLPQDKSEREVARGMWARKIAQARLEAQLKHGRAFRVDDKCGRLTPYSYDLKQIMKKQKI